jgi:dihydroneopterin aldolase
MIARVASVAVRLQKPQSPPRFEEVAMKISVTKSDGRVYIHAS